MQIDGYDFNIAVDRVVGLITSAEETLSLVHRLANNPSSMDIRDIFEKDVFVEALSDLIKEEVLENFYDYLVSNAELLNTFGSVNSSTLLKVKEHYRQTAPAEHMEIVNALNDFKVSNDIEESVAGYKQHKFHAFLLGIASKDITEDEIISLMFIARNPDVFGMLAEENY